jgi:hypothetical protein
MFKREKKENKREKLNVQVAQSPSSKSGGLHHQCGREKNIVAHPI